MKNHEQLETMLRDSLSERAGDVDTTPALYERVQRQATRGAWLRRGVALVGVAAVAVVAVVVVPPLLPAPQIDITETPDTIPPSEPAVDGPSEDAAPGVATTALQQANVVFADDTGRVTVGQRTVTAPAPVVSLAVSPFWTAADGAVAAGLADGRIGVVDQRRDGGAEFDVLVDASANGGGVAFSPDGEAIAWIEGTDLHILPLASGLEGERVPPLQGDVPDDLRIEQWFYAADAQLIFASDPSGGVWRIPMDDSDVFNSEPTAPASLLPEAADADAVDAALLSDLSLAVLRVPVDGSIPTLTLGGLPVQVEEVVDASTELSVTGSSLTLFDPTTGIGSRRDVDIDSIDLVATWEVPGVVAVAPLPNDQATDSPETLTQELGLQPLSLVGTRGTDLLVVDATSGSETVVPVYAGETEAALGLLDVRPGSTAGEAIVAYENFSEGETSIRFLALRDGEVELLDGLVVADAPLTGLVWSPDAMHVLWSTEAGTVGVADVTTADGTISTSSLDELAGEGLVATDWTWDTTGPDGDAAGQLWFSTGQGAEGATELVGVTRSGGDRVAVAGDERQVLRGVAVSPVDGRSTTVSLQDFEGRLELLVTHDDDRVQYLPLPAFLEDTPDTWPNLAMEAHDGSVIVWTEAGSSFEVRLTGQGEVRNLPDATAWTPLG